MSSASESLLLLSQAAAVIGLAAWAARIVRERLARRYPLLLSLLVAVALLAALGKVIALFAASAGRSAYAAFWLGAQLVEWTLCFLALVEAFNLMLAEYPGLHKFGVRALQAGLAVCAAFIVGGLLWAQADSVGRLGLFAIFELRNAALGLTVLALILAGVGAAFGLRPPKNIQIVFAAVGLLLAGHALVWVLRLSLGPEWRGEAAIASSLLCAAVGWGGALMFSAAGERQREFRPAATVSPAAEHEISGRIEALNESLLRVLRS